MNDIIYDMMSLHNDAIEAFLNFAEVIANEYNPSDDLDTPVNKSFREMMQKFAEIGIYLCCEANALKDGSSYCTDSNFRVLLDDEEEDCYN